jgi:hypothetical protein
MDGIDISRSHVEQVKSFKYVGSIVNGKKSIEEEIKEIISLRNKFICVLSIPLCYFKV